MNPKGSVPAIELDNGEILTEIPVLLQYLADLKPEAKLVPRAGTFERYRCQEWLNYIATELHKAFGPLWKPTTPEDFKTTVRENLAKQFDYLSTKLKGQEYLMGSFTIADAYAATIIGWAKPLKFDLTKWPVVMGYFENVRSRPGPIEAYKAEGLMK